MKILTWKLKRVFGHPSFILEEFAFLGPVLGNRDSIFIAFELDQQKRVFGCDVPSFYKIRPFHKYFKLSNLKPLHLLSFALAEFIQFVLILGIFMPLLRWFLLRRILILNC
jgi:hypothetical protein